MITIDIWVSTGRGDPSAYGKRPHLQNLVWMANSWSLRDTMLNGHWLKCLLNTNMYEGEMRHSQHSFLFPSENMRGTMQTTAGSPLESALISAPLSVTSRKTSRPLCHTIYGSGRLKGRRSHAGPLSMGFSIVSPVSTFIHSPLFPDSHMQRK